MAHGQRLFRAAAGEEKIARRADAWGARREGVRHAEGEVEPRGCRFAGSGHVGRGGVGSAAPTMLGAPARRASPREAAAGWRYSRRFQKPGVMASAPVLDTYV